MATYLTSNTGTATNAKKFTYSVWLKRSAIDTSASQRFYQGYKDGNNRFYAYFVEGADSNEDRLWIYAVTGGTVEMYWVSNRRFRDTNAWYHIVFSADSTQASQDDRFKVYVNGVEETSWTKNNNPSQNIDWGNQLAQTNNDLTISGTESQTQPFIGLMSHINFIDGTAYDASAFGETDSTTGEWKIKTSPSVTYGNNGFFILKDGNSVTDQSGNGNNFTASGDLTKTEDCPSNVYATANPLVRNQVTITTGNLTVRSTSGWKGIPATLGVESGKYYWEYKLALGVDYSQCGVMSSRPTGGYNNIYSTYVGNLEGGLALSSYGNFYHDGSSGAYGTSTWFSGGLAEYDIIGVALDATNNKIWFSQNGTWGNSSNPSTGSGGIDFSGDTDFTNYKPYFPAFSVNNSILTLNFGNGYLGTAEITTNGGNGFQDTDGNGRFYYAVPTNFRCLSTKGLNQ